MRWSLWCVLALLLSGIVAQVPEHLDIYTAKFEPFMIVDPDTQELSGYEYDMFTEIADQLLLAYPNLTYTWHVVNFDEILPNVASNPNAIGIGGISITLERENSVDFTQRYFVAGLDVMVNKLTQPNTVLKVFNPFHIWVWLVMIGLTFFSGHVIWFLERDYQPGLFPRTYIRGVNEGIWYCWGILTWTSQKTLIGFPARMYSAAWSFTCIVMVAAYVAKFTVIIATSQTFLTLNSLDDLKQQPLGVVKGSTAEIHMLAVNPDANLTRYVDERAALAGLRVGDVVAVLGDAPVLLYFQDYEDKSGTMEFLGTLILQEDYAIAMALDSPLYDIINLRLLHLQDDGTLDLLYEKYLNRVNYNLLNRTTPQLSIDVAGGLFIGLALMAGIAIMAFIAFKLLRIK